MYKIAICEDDDKYIKYMKRVISESNIIKKEEILFYSFYSGEELLFEEEHDFDLLIMDIQMKEMDGYETAMYLKERGYNPLLVFCSGVVQPSPKSFMAAPYRYLLKSYSDEEMLEEMRAIMVEMVRRKNLPYLMCSYGSGKNLVRIPMEDILYIAIRNGGTEIFLYGRLKELYSENVLRSTKKLNEIVDIFNENNGFVRAHHSYIINMAYIVEMRPNDVKLIDGTDLTVSRAKSKDFQKAFAKFMAAKYTG